MAKRKQGKIPYEPCELAPKIQKTYGLAPKIQKRIEELRAEAEKNGEEFGKPVERPSIRIVKYHGPPISEDSDSELISRLLYS